MTVSLMGHTPRNLLFSATSIDRDARDEPEPPLDPLIAAYETDLGPLNSSVLNDIETRLGVHSISRRGLTERLFSFAEGTAFGFRIEGKTYSAKDPYVQNCPIRKAIADRLKSEGGGRKVAYIETAGLLELSGGYMATMGLNTAPYGGIAFNWGFTSNSLMRYRTSTPKLLGFGENPQNLISKQRMQFPKTAEMALKMLPGSEVEITGQGKTNVNAVVAMSAGTSLPGLGRGGIGLVINNTAVVAGEMSLNVLSLNKPGLVRVTIRKLDEESSNTLIRIRAGMIFAVGAILNNLGGGMMRAYFEKLGAPNLEEFINLYTTLYATFTSRVAHRGVNIGSWDLDLNDDDASRAYEALMTLDASVAETLMRNSHPSVREIRISENEWEYAFGADVGMLGQKLFIFDALKREREGKMEGSNGRMLIYRNSIYSRRKRNLLTGSKEIHWETVSLKDGDNAESKPFLRIKFDQKNWDFGTDTLDRMLRFADAMGIPRNQIEGTAKDKLKKAGFELSKRAEVSVSTDIYFTKRGIEDIDRADKNSARDAYLKVSSIVRKKYKGLDLTSLDNKTREAVSLIEEYLSYVGIENIRKLPERIKILPQIREKYSELMGRKINDDAELYKQAEEFGASVARLRDTRNPEQVSSFFLSLGEQKGFDYMQTIAALSHLSGPEESLVNNLSILSGQIAIRNASEGSLMGPREIIANELYREVPETL